MEKLLTQNQDLLSQMQKLIAQLSQIQMFNMRQASPKDSKPVPKSLTEPLAISPSPQPASEEYSSSSSSTSSPSPNLPAIGSTYIEHPPVIEEASAENEEDLISGQAYMPTVDLAPPYSPPANNDPFAPLSAEAAQQALS